MFANKTLIKQESNSENSVKSHPIIEASSKQFKRLQFIDLAKTLGLVCVILSHTSSGYLMDWSNLFFIPIFFVCSGYTTKNSISLKTKAKHLLIPYFSLNILLFLFCAVYYRFINWKGLLKTLYSRYCLFPYGEEPNVLFFTLENYPMWFLTAMFSAFLFYKLFEVTPKKYHIIPLILMLALSFAMQYLPILFPWSLDTAPLFAIYIWIGKQIKERRLLDNATLFLLSIVLYFIIYSVSDGINLSVRIYGSNYFLSLLGGVTGSFCILYIFKNLKMKDVSLMAKINTNSLVIFSLQIPFLIFWIRLNNHYNLDIVPLLISILQLLTAFIGGYYISILLGKLSLKFCKKNYF